MTNSYYDDDDQHHHRRHRKRGHRHHNHVRVTAADKWGSQKSNNGRASSFSKGHGKSSTFSGPNTSNSSAWGKKGSGARTLFKNRQKSARNNWHSYRDSQGRRKVVSNNWASDEAQKNRAMGRGYGEGDASAMSNRHKSGASAWGKKAADTQTDFNNHFDTSKDDWSSVKVNGNWKNVRDNWSKKGRSSSGTRA